jgi:type II secretory pathway component PulF
MNHETTKRSTATTVVLLAVALVLWSSVPVVLLFVVPGYERDFRDLGLRLPAMTLATVAAGRWAGNYWYVLPLFGLLVLPVLVVLSFVVRHRGREAWPGGLWFGALLGLPVLMQMWIWLSLRQP